MKVKRLRDEFLLVEMRMEEEINDEFLMKFLNQSFEYVTYYLTRTARTKMINSQFLLLEYIANVRILL